MPKPIFLKNVHNRIDEIIRVDHAGEFGACRIYQGQIDYTKSNMITQLQHMHQQEKNHLDFFRKQLHARSVRPTLLIGLWRVLGYWLGACTAKMGKESAMICTDAVEEVIVKHYNSQLQELKNIIPQEDELIKKIDQFKQEELDHQEIAQEHLQKIKLSDTLFKVFIKSICRISIKLSQKI